MAQVIVVGVVGAAVPTELVLAAGLHPVRVSGRPRPTPLVDAYGFQEFDPPTVVVMEQLLQPDHGFDFVLIGADTLPQTTLFKTLRELQRVEPVASIPPFALLDLLHLPYRTTARYNRGQLLRICGCLGTWARAELTDERIQASVERVNCTRRLFAALRRLRRSRPARLTGVEALRLVGEALVSPPERIHRRLRELLAQEASLPLYDRKRIYLTGSSHEDESIYEAIESRGYIVVGEDHPRGELAFAGEVAATHNPLDGIVDYYQHAPLPTRLPSRQRGSLVARAARMAEADLVVCFSHAYDAASPWDLPALRDAVHTDGLRFVELGSDGIESL